MANLVYKRVSTDQQPTARQNLVLDESGIEDPVVLEEDPGTSSRLHPPAAEVPRTAHLRTAGRHRAHSEMFRLVRGTGRILDVLDVLHRDQVALRIHDDAFSAMDLTARHPRTGGLLSTVKFMVQALADAGELQRDLQRGLTYDGLRAAEAKGSKGGQRPAVATEKTEAVRTAYLEGRSIAALARDHGVSDEGVTVGSGQGYTLRVSAILAVHRQLLAHCQSLDGTPGTSATPAQRKAHREYANRVSNLDQ